MPTTVLRNNPLPLSPTDQALLTDITQLVDKPLAYVYWAFAWGEGELAGEEGPDTWQREVLLALEAQLRTTTSSVRLAVSSGNGIGKGALTAWIVQWFLVTRPECKGIVTANTGDQLSTKTWAEVAKWVRLSRVGHWMTWQATRLSNIFSPHTWFISALPWSKERPEAMAGLHAPHVLVVLDEASAIIDPIWDTLEGAMTTKRAVWLAFGNPTRNSGRFKELFPGGLYAPEWQTWRIDSRTCKKAERAQLDHWVATRGLDNDFVKVHVLGEHPRHSEEQFIGEDLIQLARAREDAPYLHLPKILGADVATTGTGCLLLRQGSKILWSQLYHNKQPDEWAALITSVMDQAQPDATFVDAVGVGAGVWALLRHTNHPVVAVNGAHAVPETLSVPSMPSDKDTYYNMRACMWGRMKEDLRVALCLPRALTDLARELQAPQWTYAGANKILLESKEDMRDRGVASPHCFVAGTLVDTPMGAVPIETISVGDEVDTPMGLRKVLRVWRSDVTELQTVRFSNGTELCGTGDHQVFTWDQGWVRLDGLLLVNRIETNNSWRRWLWQSLGQLYTPVKPFGFSQVVDTIAQTGTLRRRDFFIGASTKTTLGLSLHSMISIIRMRIPTIIPQGIWRQNQAVSTLQTICWPTWLIRSTEHEHWQGWRMHKKRPKPGMPPTKDGPGIASMASKPGKIGSLFRHTVRSVGLHSLRTSPHVRASVRTSVRSMRLISVIKQLRASVQSVAQSLWSISIACRPVVPVAVQPYDAGGPVIVYNLTLDGDNVYYANGVLVANCADALSMTYYATVRPRSLPQAQSFATPTGSPFRRVGQPQAVASGGIRR